MTHQIYIGQHFQKQRQTTAFAAYVFRRRLVNHEWLQYNGEVFLLVVPSTVFDQSFQDLVILKMDYSHLVSFLWVQTTGAQVSETENSYVRIVII